MRRLGLSVVVGGMLFFVWCRVATAQPLSPEGGYVGPVYLPALPATVSRPVPVRPATAQLLGVLETRGSFAYANRRFGVGLAGSPQNAYDNGLATYLNAGWYWDWGANGATEIPPLLYVQTVRLRPVFDASGRQVGYTASPTGSQLLARIREAPGALWFVGNEPDCHTMDNMRSQFYAYAYHDLYTFIKQADPTAQIGAGNIVQPTPLRLNYLDRVLAAYEERYGAPLPADFWSTHSYILCEKCAPQVLPGDPFAWGACYVPDWPYQFAPEATYYSVYDHWDVPIFASRLITFRQWLYDRGYRDHPVVVPEYGTLLWPGLVNTTQQDDIDFLNATADWMRSARDPVLGYAPDEGRIVQRWAWYSLDHGSWPGGSLFVNNQPTYLGKAYRAYTAGISPTVRLRVLDTDVSHSWASGRSLTATIWVTLANAGNVEMPQPAVVTVSFPALPEVVPVTGTLAPLRCCGGRGSLAFQVAGLPPGQHTFEVLAVAPVPTYYRALSDTVTGILGPKIRVARTWGQQLPPSTLFTTATLYAVVENIGNAGTVEPITVSFVYTDGTAVVPIGQRVLPPLDSGEQAEASILWSNLEDGQYTYCVSARTSYQTAPTVCTSLWINPPYALFLPLVMVGE